MTKIKEKSLMASDGNNIERTGNRCDVSAPRYAGFFVRFLAQVLDLIIFAVLTIPFALILKPKALPDFKTLFIGTGNAWVDLGLPLAVILICWAYRAGTPGKWLFKLRIVDARTQQSLKPDQVFIRVIGYILAFLPLGLGYFWVLFDRRKQGLHDKLARTVVVYKPE
ncbi:MAG: RDD family protein [Cellvibrionales bacterium]|nr:RDD family protein [Cellvibrionales bacterium]